MHALPLARQVPVEDLLLPAQGEEVLTVARILELIDRGGMSDEGAHLLAGGHVPEARTTLPDGPGYQRPAVGGEIQRPDGERMRLPAADLLAGVHVPQG